MIKKLYNQFKRYNIKIAREKAQKRGVVFNEKLYAKSWKAWSSYDEKILHFSSKF